MRKKQPKNDPFPVGMDEIGELKPRERLKIQDVRRRVAQLRGFLAENRLPDWTDLTHRQRFAIAIRLLLPEQREQLLRRSEKTLARYETDGEIPFPVVAALAIETEIPLDWIATGHGSEFDARQASEPVGPATIIATDDVTIQLLASTSSSQRGTLGSGRSIRFPRAILERIGVKPENARILEATGDAMKPTIGDGDIMVIDVSSNKIAEGKVYAFSLAGRLTVRRLRQLGDKIVMMSDNKEVFASEEAVPPDQPFHIIGQVKWAGRAL